MKQTVSREQFLKYAQYNGELLEIEKQYYNARRETKTTITTALITRGMGLSISGC